MFCFGAGVYFAVPWKAGIVCEVREGRELSDSFVCVAGVSGSCTLRVVSEDQARGVFVLLFRAAAALIKVVPPHCTTVVLCLSETPD